MRNIFLFIMIFLSIIVCQSQVSINTQNPLGIFHIDGKSDNQVVISPAQILNDFIVSQDGHVGIGSIPSVKLDINTGGKSANIMPGFKLTDGNQGAGRVLVSDAQGIGSWRNLTQTALKWNAQREFTVPHTGIYLITLYLDDNNTTNAYTNKWVNPTLDAGTTHNEVSLWSITRGLTLISSMNVVKVYGVSCSGTLLLLAGETLVARNLAWNGGLYNISTLGVEIIAL